MSLSANNKGSRFNATNTIGICAEMGMPNEMLLTYQAVTEMFGNCVGIRMGNPSRLGVNVCFKPLWEKTKSTLTGGPIVVGFLPEDQETFGREHKNKTGWPKYKTQLTQNLKSLMKEVSEKKLDLQYIRNSSDEIIAIEFTPLNKDQPLPDKFVTYRIDLNDPQKKESQALTASDLQTWTSPATARIEGGWPPEINMNKYNEFPVTYVVENELTSNQGHDATTQWRPLNVAADEHGRAITGDIDLYYITHPPGLPKFAYEVCEPAMFVENSEEVVADLKTKIEALSHFYQKQVSHDIKALTRGCNADMETYAQMQDKSGPRARALTNRINRVNGEIKKLEEMLPLISYKNEDIDEGFLFTAGAATPFECLFIMTTNKEWVQAQEKIIRSKMEGRSETDIQAAIKLHTDPLVKHSPDAHKPGEPSEHSPLMHISSVAVAKSSNLNEWRAVFSPDNEVFRDNAEEQVFLNSELFSANQVNPAKSSLIHVHPGWEPEFQEFIVKEQLKFHGESYMEHANALGTSSIAQKANAISASIPNKMAAFKERLSRPRSRSNSMASSGLDSVSSSRMRSASTSSVVYDNDVSKLPKEELQAQFKSKLAALKSEVMDVAKDNDLSSSEEEEKEFRLK